MVVYVGDSRSREVIRSFEFPVDQSGSGVAGIPRQRAAGRSRAFRFEVRCIFLVAAAGGVETRRGGRPAVCHFHRPSATNCLPPRTT